MAGRRKKHAHSAARESALALLYSSDITEQNVIDIVEAGRYPADDIDFAPYAESLVRGVCDQRERIDQQLVAVSENWALDRMPVVDRAILRLAVYEMLFVEDVPVSVTINEAVELAKAYGGEDDSSRFVNGVLGRIARQLEAESASVAAAAEASENESAAEESAPVGEESAAAEEDAAGFPEEAPLASSSQLSVDAE